MKLQLKEPRLQSPIGSYEGRQSVYKTVPSHDCQLEASSPQARSVLRHGGWLLWVSDLRENPEGDVISHHLEFCLGSLEIEPRVLHLLGKHSA